MNSFANYAFIDENEEDEDYDELAESIIEELSVDMNDRTEMMIHALRAGMTKPKQKKNACNYCDAPMIKSDSMLVCSNPKCGVVDSDVCDDNHPQHSYDKPTPQYAPKSSVQSSDSSNRLKLKQGWNTSDHRTQSLAEKKDIITTICDVYGFQKIIGDDTMIFYKLITDCKHKKGKKKGKNIIIRGNNVINVLAACFVKACENNQFAIKPNEIAEMFCMESARVTAGIKKFHKIIDTTDNGTDIFVNKLANLTATYNITNRFIVRRYLETGIGEQGRDLAMRMSDNCMILRQASNHSADSLAGGLLLMIFVRHGFDVNDKKLDISRIFGLSKSTIMNVYTELDYLYNVLANDELTLFVRERYPEIEAKIKKKLNR